MYKFCPEMEGADDTLQRSVSSSAGRSENGHAGCWCRQSSQPVLLERVADDLGEPDAAGAVVKAIEKVLKDGPKTRDIGGSASTEEVGKAIAEAV